MFYSFVVYSVNNERTFKNHLHHPELKNLNAWNQFVGTSEVISEEPASPPVCSFCALKLGLQGV